MVLQEKVARSGFAVLSLVALLWASVAAFLLLADPELGVVAVVVAGCCVVGGVPTGEMLMNRFFVAPGGVAATLVLGTVIILEVAVGLRVVFHMRAEVFAVTLFFTSFFVPWLLIAVTGDYERML